MNAYLDRLDQQIAARHLLTHPFYLAWTRGELRQETLADYADPNATNRPPTKTSTAAVGITRTSA